MDGYDADDNNLLAESVKCNVTWGLVVNTKLIGLDHTTSLIY